MSNQPPKSKTKNSDTSPLESIGNLAAPPIPLARRGMRAGEPDNFVSLVTLVEYLNGRSVSAEDHRKIESQLVNFKSNLNGFMTMVVYKQMQRLARLLDAADAMEARLYTAQTISELDIEGLNKMAFTIQNSMNKTLEFLMQMTNDVNMRNMLNKSEAFLTPPGKTDDGSKIKVDVTSFSKESRDRIRSVANWVIASVHKESGQQSAVDA